MERKLQHLGGALLVGIFLGAVAMALISDHESTNLSVAVGSLSLGLETVDGKIDQQKLLDDMYAENFARDGLMGWLRKKSIYEISDQGLADALNQDLCEPIPEEPIASRIATGAACAEKPVARRLRELVQGRQPPFHYVGSEIEVGIPSADDGRPDEGRANACQEGPLVGRKVLLMNPLNEKEIEVLATGRYACPGFRKTADLQLHPNDANRIFDGALDKYNDAVAVVMN